MMDHRIWKIVLAVGVAAGLCALLLSMIGGSHVSWTWGDRGANFDVRVGGDDSAAAKFLGTVAVLCLILGSAFLAATQQPKTSGDMSNLPSSNSFLSFLQNLKRSKTDCWLGGVCGGLGAHSPVPSWVWRLLMLLLVFCLGTGVLAYVVLWICIPEEKPPTPVVPGV